MGPLPWATACLSLWECQHPFLWISPLKPPCTLDQAEMTVPHSQYLFHQNLPKESKTMWWPAYSPNTSPILTLAPGSFPLVLPSLYPPSSSGRHPSCLLHLALVKHPEKCSRGLDRTLAWEWLIPLIGCLNCFQIFIFINNIVRNILA